MEQHTTFIPALTFDLSKTDKSAVLQFHRLQAERSAMLTLPDSELAAYLDKRKAAVSVLADGHSFDYNPSDLNEAMNAAPLGSTLVIHANGFIQKDSDFWSMYGFATSTDEVAELVRMADANPRFDSIIFKVNSSGGGADGNELLSKVIQSANIRTFAVFNKMCSAALEAFKSADFIYGEERQSKIGSYGEMATWFDEVKYMEAGESYHEIYAPQSTAKNAEVRGLREDPVDDTVLKAALSKNVEIMFQGMREQRPQLTSNVWQDGRVFNTIEATEIGLADGVKSFHELVSELQQQQTIQRNNSGLIQQRRESLELLNIKQQLL